MPKNAWSDKSFRIAVAAAAVALIGAIIGWNILVNTKPEIGKHPERPTLDWDYSDDRVAAKIGDITITEGDVTRSVAYFREAYGLTDDKDWTAWLEQQGTDPESVRNQMLEDLLQQQIVSLEGKKKKITLTDNEVAEEIEANKEALYASRVAAREADAAEREEGIISESQELSEEEKKYLWEDMLAATGMVEQSYKEAVRMYLMQDKLIEAVGSDLGYASWHDEFVASLEIETHPMPEDVPYNVRASE